MKTETKIKMPMTNTSYLRYKGTLCPACGCNDLEASEVEQDVATSWQSITCLDCNAEWKDVYVLHMYTDLTMPVTVKPIQSLIVEE